MFGFAELRPGQDDILRAVLAGEDVLAVMPTGAGKSLCYQLPAILRGGLTVVVSPLIALMRDQVNRLTALGIAAGALHSGNGFDERRDIESALAAGRLRLLYVAPERLVRGDTRGLLARAGVDLLAIDEAHCVSQWGHDFRPEYLALRETADAVRARQILAVTATADPPTRAEIIRKLFAAQPNVFVRSFDRPNLRLAMERKLQPVVQIDAMLARHRGSSGIVYCASRKGVEKLAETLSNAGRHALPYHAGLPAEQRAANQDAFLQGDGVVMVATIAFGMGIDKPDVRFVCHADLPGSIEAYYQEVGRAGRDGLPADTLTLFGEADVQLRERQIAESDAPAERKAVERRRLQALLALCETPRCRRQTLLAAFGEAAEPCGNCDVCEGRWRFFDGSVAAQKMMSAILRTAGRFQPTHLANLLIGKATEAIRRHGHDDLPTFGIGREMDAGTWRSLFRQILAAGLIENDLEDRDRWVLTEAGRAVLKGEATIPLREEAAGRQAAARRVLQRLAADADEGPARRTANLPEAASTADLDAAALRLLAALKAKRLDLARGSKLPPYVIFNDRTLIEMAARRPRTTDELLAVNGVGETKAARYGPAFLAIIDKG